MKSVSPAILVLCLLAVALAGCVTAAPGSDPAATTAVPRPAAEGESSVTDPPQPAATGEAGNRPAGPTAALSAAQPTPAEGSAAILATAAASPSVDAAAFEAKTGLQITLAAVTAAGGLVDFRWKVTDPAKAQAILTDPLRAPVLLGEKKAAVLTLNATAPAQIKLEAGQVYFFLYGNPGGVVKPGDTLTVLVDGVRLEHVPVK